MLCEYMGQKRRKCPKKPAREKEEKKRRRAREREEKRSWLIERPPRVSAVFGCNDRIANGVEGQQQRPWPLPADSTRRGGKHLAALPKHGGRGHPRCAAEATAARGGGRVEGRGGGALRGSAEGAGGSRQAGRGCLAADGRVEVPAAGARRLHQRQDAALRRRAHRPQLSVQRAREAG